MTKRLALSTPILLIALSSSAWAQSDKFTITSYQVEGNSLLPEARITEVLSPFTGTDRNINDINSAAEALRKAYEQVGYPVVRVFPPQQQAEKGQIQLKVLEGQIESIIVKGNQAYDEGNILASLPPLQVKSKPNIKQIVASIAAANENPAKQVAVNFQAAEQIGNIDAVVSVTEDRPQKFTVSADNMGSPSTGINRINFGYQNANLFNRDHMVTAQFGTSFDKPSNSQSISGGYRIPYYAHGLSLDLIGSYSRSDASTEVGFGSTQFTGRGTMLGARLNQALPSEGEYRHRIIYGIDHKDFDNTCTGVNAGTCGSVTAQPLSATYFATLAKPEYQLSAGITYAMNIRGGAHGSAAQYALARAGAEPDWSVWRATAGMAVPLPSNLQFRVNLTGQMSKDRVVPAEQYGVGGASSVRGYSERSATGDSGYGATFELYSPDFGKRLHEQLSVQALAFYDFGEVDYTAAIAGIGEKKTSLASVGLGLRINQGRDLSAKIDSGFVQKRFDSAPQTGSARSDGDVYTHIALNYQF